MKKTIFFLLLLFLVFGCTLPKLPFDFGAKPTDLNADKNVVSLDQNLTADVNAVDQNKPIDANIVQDKNVAVDRNTATLMVFINSPDGNVLQGATVTAEGAEKGLTNKGSGATNENGFISFNLPEGNYKVTVEKEGFVTQSTEKKIISGLQNIARIGLEKPAAPSPYEPGINPIKWTKLLNDGSISIEPAGFLLVKRGERRLVLNIEPDFIGELGNKTFEWRLKIIEGSSTGFNLKIELFTPTKKLLKIQHSTDRVNMAGADISKADVDLKSDYHTVKVVINSDERASLFVDGKEAVSNQGLSGGLTLLEPKRLFFESHKGITSLDYFYVDMDNDGKWDYKEDWNNLDNVS